MRYKWKPTILMIISVMLSMTGCGNSAPETENSTALEMSVIPEAVVTGVAGVEQESEPETDEEIFLENYAEQNEEKFGYYADLSEEFEKSGCWNYNNMGLLSLWGKEGYNASGYINGDYGNPYYRNGCVYFLHWYDEKMWNLIRYSIESGEWVAFPVGTDSSIEISQCVNGRLCIEGNRMLSVFNMDSLNFDYQVELEDYPIELCLLSNGAVIYDKYHYYSPETGFVEIPKLTIDGQETEYVQVLGGWGDNIYYSSSIQGGLYCYHPSAQSWEELPVSMDYMTSVVIGKYVILSDSNNNKTILFDMEKGEQVGRAYPSTLYYYGGDSHLMIDMDFDGNETNISSYMKVKVPINGSKVDSKDKQTLGSYSYGIFQRDYPKELNSNYFLTFDTSGVYLNSYDGTERKQIFNYQYPES